MDFFHKQQLLLPGRSLPGGPSLILFSSFFPGVFPHGFSYYTMRTRGNQTVTVKNEQDVKILLCSLSKIAEGRKIFSPFPRKQADSGEKKIFR